MPVVARELTITYGGYSVGGDQANRRLDGLYISDQGFDSGSVEYSFVVSGATEQAFASEVSVAEAAFHVPYQALTITLGSQTIKSYSHSSSTGFNAQPKILKRGDFVDSGRARRYTVRIEFGLPADVISLAGRRTSNVNVDYLPSRRRMVTISGTWTAIGSTTARAQYEAQIGAYATSVLDALGGTYKLAEEPVTRHDDQNKLLEFSRVHEEIIFTGVGSGDASVRKESLIVSRDHRAEGNTPQLGQTINQWVILTARYECWIDYTSSTDLRGKWDSLRGSVFTQIANTLNGGSIAITSEKVAFDYTMNKIMADITATGSQGGGFRKYRRTLEEIIRPGHVLVPVWVDNPLVKYRYQGPMTWQFRLTETYEIETGWSPNDTAFPNPRPDHLSVLMEDTITTTPIRIGRESRIIDYVEVQRVRLREMYDSLPTGATVEGPAA